jgi:hypothetical protein
MSAANSISSLLSKTLDQAQQTSTSEERNSTTYRPNLFHNYTIQVQVKKEVHEKNMKEGKQDNFDVYNFCNLLQKKEWEEYCKNPLSDKFKRDFLDKMTKQSDYNLSKLSNKEKKVKINNYPPYGIKWDSMTLDVGKIKGGIRQVDPHHYNGYYMLPLIITILRGKIKNEIQSKIVGDATNKSMINFICWYAFVTRAYNQNSTHPVVAEYLPGVKAEYLNMCKGTNKVIPVAVFLMTMYNACFMYQTTMQITC